MQFTFGDKRGLPVGRECPTCDWKRKEGMKYWVSIFHPRADAGGLSNKKAKVNYSNFYILMIPFCNQSHAWLLYHVKTSLDFDEKIFWVLKTFDWTWTLLGIAFKVIFTIGLFITLIQRPIFWIIFDLTSPVPV